RAPLKRFSLKKALPCAAVLLAAASVLPSCAEEKKNETVEPLFAPTLESMEANFHAPQWYKDAKFGIFTHWGPQCQPESGDWYARNM
ncbi:MAG: alpha-L-fucosidase, partial [Lentisphaeria bacterium]|nr:alpha-L-fucosidase [Lentisphaeria bacterium]